MTQPRKGRQATGIRQHGGTSRDCRSGGGAAHFPRAGLLTDHPIHLLHVVPVQSMLAAPEEVLSGDERDVGVQEGHTQKERPLLVSTDKHDTTRVDCFCVCVCVWRKRRLASQRRERALRMLSPGLQYLALRPSPPAGKLGWCWSVFHRVVSRRETPTPDLRVSGVRVIFLTRHPPRHGKEEHPS